MTKAKREVHPFVTLYIPRKEWFHQLLQNQMKRDDISLSGQLIKLILRDLEDKKLLNKKEIEQGFNTHSMKTKKSSRKKFKTFMLYIPEHLYWLPQRLDKLTTSRSFYIWNLFVRAHFDSLSAAARKEWGDPDQAKPPKVGKKAAVEEEEPVRRKAPVEARKSA